MQLVPLQSVQRMQSTAASSTATSSTSTSSTATTAISTTAMGPRPVTAPSQPSALTTAPIASALTHRAAACTALLTASAVQRG